MGVISPPGLDVLVLPVVCDGAVQRFTSDAELWGELIWFQSSAVNAPNSVIYVGKVNADLTLPASVTASTAVLDLLAGGGGKPRESDDMEWNGEVFQLNQFCVQGTAGAVIRLTYTVRK